MQKIFINVSNDNNIQYWIKIHELKVLKLFEEEKY